MDKLTERKIVSFESINWTQWTPDESATLLFVVCDERILLIRKKRGLGAGKVNGPGGRLEAGETMRECAVRETREELGIVALSASLRGRHRFQFSDGYALQVFVYLARSYEGTPIETDEAIPLWTDISKIPYQEMWEDDEIWLPRLLQGEQFDGRYLFDDDKMLGHVLDTVECAEAILPPEYRER